MSNVHTLRDLASEPFPQSQSRGQQGQYHRNSSLFNDMGSGPQGEDGRLQNPKCIDIVFPKFNWKTFILFVSIAQTIVYIVSVSLGSSGLTPFNKSLESLGASDGPAIARGEVWRFITPLFLHGSFWHLLFNIFFQLRMGFPLEAQYGFRNFMLIYFICGIFGNAFSVALKPCKIAVGASTAGFGLIGLQMAEISLIYQQLGPEKSAVIFNISLFLLFAIMMSVAPGSVVDWRGHLGGFIAGVCLGIIYTRLPSKPK